MNKKSKNFENSKNSESWLESKIGAILSLDKKPQKNNLRSTRFKATWSNNYKSVS